MIAESTKYSTTANAQNLEVVLQDNHTLASNARYGKNVC
jgi:hypothetical protein